MVLRGPSPVAEGFVGDDLLGCGPFDKDGTRGAHAKTAQEGPGAAAVAEKAIAIEEVPALS